MDQKSLMLDAAEKLAALSETLKALADSVQAEEAKGTDSQPEKAKAPEKKPPAITLEKVRGILADKSRAGHTAEVRAIIQKHGATCHSPAVRITPMAELHAVRKTGAGVR